MESKVINKIRIVSVVASVILGLIGWVILRDKFWFAGVVIGCMAALIGFNMILKLTYTVQESNSVKATFSNYLLRYVFYGCIFALAIVKGISALSLLVGFVAHKVVIFVYTKKLS